jgi:hypothetical protein
MLYGNFPGGTEENHNKLQSYYFVSRAEIRTQCRPDTSAESYRYPYGRMYSCGGTVEIKILMPPSVTTNLGYDISFFFFGPVSENKQKYKLIALLKKQICIPAAPTWSIGHP